MTILSFLLLVTACTSAEIESTTEAVTDEPTATESALEAVEPTETTIPTATAAPTETAVRPTPTEAATMTPEPTTFTGPVIILRRSGGLAGLEDKWTIYADGRVAGAPTAEDPLSSEHIAQILAEAETGGFFELNERYIDEGHCCDFFTYEVTINLPDGRSHTITTMEQTPSMPPVLAEVIRQLNFLLFRERTQA